MVFKNLVDLNGKPIVLDVPDKEMYVLAAKAGRKAAENFKKMFKK